MGVQTEIEVKLTGEAEAFAAFAMSAFWRDLAAGKDAERYASVYFDTPAFACRAAGLSVRVREERAGYVQTVKAQAGGGGAALARLEDNAVVPGPKLKPRKIKTDAIRDRIAAIGAEDIGPVCEINVRRQTAEITLDGARIEIAFDEGEAEAGDRTAPLRQIELELLDGPPRALYTLAERLIAQFRLRLTRTTKADIGYRLAGAPLGGGVKARTVRLRPDMSAGEALGESLKSAAVQIFENAEVIHQGDTVEGVHQMRVGARRLRALWSIYKKAAYTDRFQNLVSDAKYFASILGPVRDLDVFLTETVEPLRAAAPEETCLAALADAAAARRAEAMTTALNALRDLRFARFCLGLSTALAEEDWRGGAKPKVLKRPAVQFADRALAKRWANVLDAGADFTHLPPDERHPLRIELKKLRYTARAFRTLYPETELTGPRSFLQQLSRLQDAFGVMNDALVAISLVKTFANGHGDTDRAAGLVIGWRARDMGLAWAEAQAEWTRLLEIGAFWGRG